MWLMYKKVLAGGRSLLLENQFQKIWHKVIVLVLDVHSQNLVFSQQILFIGTVLWLEYQDWVLTVLTVSWFCYLQIVYTIQSPILTGFDIVALMRICKAFGRTTRLLL